MRETILVVSQAALRFQELLTGSEISSSSQQDSIASAFCVAKRGHLTSGFVGVFDLTKPVIKLFRLDKIDAPCKRLTLSEPIVVAASSGVFLAAGSKTGTLNVWDITTGALLRSCLCCRSSQAITHLQFTADYLVAVQKTQCSIFVVSDLAASLDENVDTQNVDDPVEPWLTFRQHSANITAMDVWSEQAAGIVATGSSDGVCHIWHLSSGHVLSTIDLGSAVTCLRFDPHNPNFLFAGLESGTVILINVAEAKSKFRGELPLSVESFEVFVTHAKPVKQFEVSPSGSHCVTISDNHVWIWARTTRHLHRKQATQDVISYIAILAHHDTCKDIAESASTTAKRVAVLPGLRNLENAAYSTKNALNVVQITSSNYQRLIAASSIKPAQISVQPAKVQPAQISIQPAKVQPAQISVQPAQISDLPIDLWRKVLKEQGLKELQESDQWELQALQRQYEMSMSIISNVCESVGRHLNSLEVCKDETIDPHWTSLIKSILPGDEEDMSDSGGGITVKEAWVQPIVYSEPPLAWSKMRRVE